jgi:pyruvate/2-oxoglutarate/acetoin dehydrogenase E1 component
LSVEDAQSEVTYAEAIRCALEDAMDADASIVLLGQDIASGFPFGATRELAARFGHERVRDTPISEAATMGCGIGAAMTGTRTVVEVDFAGFLLLGLDQLVGAAAKLRYMSGGQLRVGLVVRVGQGPFGAFAAQHSQSQHAWLASVPGLALCTPSDPQEAYELMRWALRQRDPVVFAEDMRLYRARGGLRRESPAADVRDEPPGVSSAHTLDPPDGELATAPGVPRARVLRSGRDATVVCFGYGTTLALAAAEELAAEGIELEVLDLRLLSPLDGEAVGRSARHTGRVLCLGDDPLLGGITATLAAVADERAHGALTAPVARLGARHWPTPFGAGEAFVYPSARSVATAARRLVRWPAALEGEIEHGAFAMAEQ